MLGWVYIAFATVAELFGIFGLSLYSRKRTFPRWLLYYGGIAASFTLLYLSFEYLNVSIAYTVFTGAGTAGAVILNIFFFNESRSMFRLLSLAFIIVGVMGLKYTSTLEDEKKLIAAEKEDTTLVEETGRKPKLTLMPVFKQQKHQNA